MATEAGRGVAVNSSSVVELSTALWEELGGEVLQAQVALGFLGKSLSRGSGTLGRKI